MAGQKWGSGAGRWPMGVLGVAIVGLAITLAGCAVNLGGVTGSGNVKTETRQVSGFTKIQFSGVGALNITQADKESLSVSAEDNLLPLLASTVSGDTLTLGVKPGNNIRPTRPITYTLTLKHLASVHLSGAGSIHATGIQTSALDIDLSGAGQMTIDGSAQSQTVLLSGVGSYSARGLQTASTQVTISGAGSATVSASQTLTATVSGAGSVTYYGLPQVTKSISGAGSVNQGK